MTEARDEERTPLREERERLATERAEPQAEVPRLEASRDVDALRALAARLHRHAEALHAFHDGLEAFHQRFGPLGPSCVSHNQRRAVDSCATPRHKSATCMTNDEE